MLWSHRKEESGSKKFGKMGHPSSLSCPSILLYVHLVAFQLAAYHTEDLQPLLNLPEIQAALELETGGYR